MTQYLVAIHHPDNYDPSKEGEAMARNIDTLNEEMVAAGVRIFVGGLTAASDARSLRAQPDGKVLVTDGPYLETKEHIGGFWILEAARSDLLIYPVLLGTGKRFFSDGTPPRELALVSTKAGPRASSSAPTNPAGLCGRAPKTTPGRKTTRGLEELNPMLEKRQGRNHRRPLHRNQGTHGPEFAQRST